MDLYSLKACSQEIEEFAVETLTLLFYYYYELV